MQGSALVFGATGGIGRLIVRHLAEHGWKVTAAARSLAVEEAGVLPVLADVADASQVTLAFDRHAAAWSSVPDAVVNAAALQGPIGHLLGSRWGMNGREPWTSI